MSKLKENVIAFIWAVLLTWWVILFLWTSSNNIATDVLWAKKNNINKTYDTNVVFNKDKLELISNRNIDNVATVSLELLFNKKVVNISQKDFDSKYNISVAKKEWGNGYDVIIQWLWNIKVKQVLLNINNITNKQFDNINIGHISVIDNNGNVIDLTNEKK